MPEEEENILIVRDDICKIEVLDGDWHTEFEGEVRQPYAGCFSIHHEDGRSLSIDQTDTVRYYAEDGGMVHEDTDPEVVEVMKTFTVGVVDTEAKADG